MSPANQILKSYSTQNNESTIKQRHWLLTYGETGAVMKLLVTALISVISTWCKFYKSL